jgi:cytochrome P450
MSLPNPLFLLNTSLLLLISSYIVLDIDLTSGLFRTTTSKLTSFLLIPFYLLSLLIYNLHIHPTYLSPLRHLPSAPQPPPLTRILTEPEAPELTTWLNTIPNNGLLRFRGRLNSPRILITTPAGCDTVLQTHAASFSKEPAVRKILQMWLGTDTLLSSTNGDGHKTLRKRLLPAFYARNIRELAPVFWAKANQMCEALHRVVAYNNDRVLEVNLDDLIDRAALDVVGLAGYGVDFDTLRSPGGQMGRLHKRAFDLGDQEVQVVLSAMFLPDGVFSRLPFKVYRKNRVGVKALRKYCRGVIREEVVGKNAEKNANSIVGMAAQMERFSEDDLVDLSMDLLVAGHKTASSALQVAFYTLAQHPEVQSRLRDEVWRAYPDIANGVLPDASANADPKLPYLDAVLNELLRLYPPVAHMSRLTVSTTVVCGVPIPAGSKVVVSQWAMNRSHAQWGPDASEFRPERWLEEGGTGRPHLLTFSKGPRNCIGEGFARKELAVLVSAMIARFELSIVQGDEENGGRVRSLQQGITVKVKGGCRVGVRELVRR